MFGGDCHSAKTHSAWVKAEAQKQAALKSKQKAALSPAIEVARKSAEAGNLGGMRRLVELLAERFDVHIQWREPDAHSFGYASGRAMVVIPPITSAQRFAVGLHELGHTQAETCHGADHQPQFDGGWRKCLRCETVAWELAMQWCLFDREMFSELQRGLSIYRGSTPGPANAVQALDRTKGTLRYFEEVQKRHRWNEMVEKTERARRT